MQKTAAVISYASYQKQYIKRLVKECKKFVSGEIVVVSFDKLFNGTKEEPLKSFSEIDLRLKYEPGYPSRYYHNLQRKAGYDVLQEDYDAIFFIDADEVPIGDKMKEWLDNAEVKDYRFASYWYYRDTCFQAVIPVDSIALVSVKSLNTANWFGNSERENYSEHHLWNRLTVGYGDKPMVHHYGWAGTKEMLLTKVTAWGHNEDRNWVELVENEFKHKFDLKCPWKPHDKYIKVKPFIGFYYDKQNEN